ncbi:kynureninase [Sphingosinicella sp. CPCC 101087]|uniref:kynureninase n=1 Tax=Sphingosinicella sp. CPCC 101087 TaxID=2497754 RepID=UPI00101C6B6F|nr:kynureninase [Sphingosinicella sp. CPCC 101087]
MIDREAAVRLDAADPLRPYRDRFRLPPGCIYLDGNSLGALPATTSARLTRVVEEEWGQHLIRSWNDHDWIAAPARIGAKIARLIGATSKEVIVADSTSANLFKLIVAALRARPDRRAIVTEAGNFPTDLYVTQSAADLIGAELRTVSTEHVLDAISEDVALVVLTHVHYKTAARLDMRRITQAAHAKGALILWDLSHSAGAVELDLNGAAVDLAVGCGYKYLNGGPGAPSFLYIAERHQPVMHSPVAGWMGHRDPFAFRDQYVPAEGVDRFLCGTPPLLSLLSLEAGLDVLADADMGMIEGKARMMGDFFIAAVEQSCSGFGLELASCRDSSARGSHVSFAHPQAYAIMQALIRRNVIGDFRAPDIARFGLTPLYLGFEDLWNAVEILRDVLHRETWRSETQETRARVT